MFFKIGYKYRNVNHFHATNNFSNFTVNIHTDSDENLFEVDVHKLVS